MRINHDLLLEVIRLRDAASMFPRTPSKGLHRTMSIMSTVTPSDITTTKPPREELKPHRTKLTAKHKAILRGLSAKIIGGQDFVQAA